MPTIVFTDIEGSTRLWEERREAMAQALARHDTILSDAIRAGGGRVLKTTGDGFIAVFESPASAVTTVLHIQEALSAEPWEASGPIRVRMGVHTGETESRGNDLFGPTMNRTARIMAVGHGGQVLLSAAVAELVKGDLPAGATLLDLGSHRLKDLTQPENIYQLSAPTINSQFPTLRTLDARPNNLPIQATEFLGRTSELAAIRQLLEVPSTRLVTITGPGGVGKTRLSLQVASEMSDQFPGGVFFIDLSEEKTPEAVFEAAVRALDLPLAANGSPLETLKTRLHGRQLLLVLDNFEQVVEAAASVSELLQEVAGLKIVVTSRELLRIRAEKVFVVPPLALPANNAPTDAITDSEAVRFFEERARAVRPDFTLNDSNVATVAEICRRLDALPLAIELAAARLKLFTPADLLTRLQDRLDILGSGGRDLPVRQRTLWGAIGWSYELLDETEREVFEAMSVFASASLDAIEAVGQSALGVTSVLESLASLVDKSLVQSREEGRVQRFSMLRMVSDYAASRLAATPEEERVLREEHARYFATLAAERKDLMRDAEQSSTMAEIEIELGNLRSAWLFWVERGDVENLLRMIDSLWALHESRGWYYTAIDLARDALEVLERSGRWTEFAAEELTIRTSLARALMAIGGYNIEVEREFERVIELAQMSGKAAEEFPALRSLASYYIQRTSWAASSAIGRRLIELGGESHNPLMLAEGHYVIAASTAFTDPPGALANLDEAISLFGRQTPSSDRFRLGPNSGVLTRNTSAFLLWQHGDFDKAVAQILESLELARTINHPYSIAYALYHNGFFAINRGRFGDCMEYARELGVVAEANEYPLWATLARLLEGVATAALGNAGDGLAMTEAAVDLYQGLTPPPVFWPFVLMLRAAVHTMAGQVGRAIELLDEASATIAPLPVDMPAIKIMKADFLRLLPAPEAWRSEALYEEAIAEASEVDALHEMLTGLTGLVTLRRSRGVVPDGSEELAAVYRAITEGNDENDVAAARDVLGAALT